jgi:hypothetical protein
MPLIVPNLPKIDNFKTLLGKRIVEETTVMDVTDYNYPIDNVVFRSQLPENALLLNQDVEKTAIVQAFKEGKIPLIIDNRGIVIQTF